VVALDDETEIIIAWISANQQRVLLPLDPLTLFNHNHPFGFNVCGCSTTAYRADDDH
jgi:hypothetical protein